MKKKKSNYFIERFPKQENIAHEMGVKKQGQLKAIYREARKELESDLALFIERYSGEKELTAADIKKMLNTKERAHFRYTVEGYLKEIDKLGGDTKEGKTLKKELDILAGRTRVSRREEMLTGIQVELAKASMKSTEVIGKHLESVVDFAYKDTMKLLGNNTMAKLEPQTIKKIVNQKWDSRNYSDRIWKNRKGLARQVMRNVTTGFIQGHDFSKMSKRLSKDMNVGFYQARRLIETETTGALENAKSQVFQEMGITKYKFIATIDDRTSDICRSLDGKIFEEKDRQMGVNCPFCHPFCRSVTVPIIDKEALKKKIEEYKELKLVSRKYEDIKEKEPYITHSLKSITSKLGISLEGLDFRTKTFESLIRKVEKDSIEDGISRTEAFDKLKDVVRYTTVLPEKEFTKKYFEMERLLKEEGYDIIKVKNTWQKGSAYKGINTTLNASGLNFEMQYHTKNSLKVKDKLHKLYEEERLISTTLKRKIELKKEMKILSGTLSEPKGVEKIK